MNLCEAWITEADLVDCNCETGSLAPAVVEEVLMAATEFMYKETGSQWPGICEVVERPCGCGCGCGLMTIQWHRLQGFAFPGDTCCSGLCGCSSESKIALSYGPVLSAEVSIDGVAFTDFEIVAPNLIVRTDDGQWPSCQSYTNGWTVTYSFGESPPALVKLAAQDLVVELVKSCLNQECKLPSGTTFVNRRGVAISIDPNQAAQALPRVGMALRAFGRKGRTDLIIPGRRGLVTSHTSGS